MQLTCPNCNEKIIAGNINIQDKIAVCHQCDTVFQFSIPDSSDKKAKRRKVHQPHDLTLHDEERLHMSFRTNWRLDQNETFLTGAILGVLFTFISVMLISEGELNLLPFIIGLIAFAGYYTAALTAYNKTHITMNDVSIKTSRLPLPGSTRHHTEVNLANVESITTEETAMSAKEGFDLPRYNVYANRFDGSRQVIIKDVTEEYGQFIAQTLNAELSAEDDHLDMSRLEDKPIIIDDIDHHESESQQSSNHNNPI